MAKWFYCIYDLMCQHIHGSDRPLDLMGAWFPHILPLYLAGLRYLTRIRILPEIYPDTLPVTLGT